MDTCREGLEELAGKLTREMCLAQVLHDFWGNGLADEKVDRELVVKIAEALGCDPSRLNIEWSRITGGEYGAADSDGLDNVDNDAVSIEEEEDENADVGLEGVHTIRQE